MEREIGYEIKDFSHPSGMERSPDFCWGMDANRCYFCYCQVVDPGKYNNYKIFVKESTGMLSKA